MIRVYYSEQFRVFIATQIKNVLIYKCLLKQLILLMTKSACL